MSGIIGIITDGRQLPDSAILDKCQQDIATVCDDYSGSWKSNKADLRFSLLQTSLDTEPEQLPFSTDNNLRIVGEVRLDNRLKLIDELNLKNQKISLTTPDSYLVLYAYKHWDEDCLNYIAGDYAFAIWNEQESKLFCARDHFGMIPFYYTQLQDGLLFTNFYRALRQVPGLMDELNDEVLKAYFLPDEKDEFAQTIYKKILKLPPAHKLVYVNGNVEITRYRDMEKFVKPLRYKTTAEYVAHFSGLLEQSVADRARNNKIGCALSGGMDSSSVTAITKKALSALYPDNFAVKAFNIKYAYLVYEREGDFAKLTAKHLGIPLEQYVAEDYLKNIAEPSDTWLPEPAGLMHASAESHIIADNESFSRIFLGGFGGDPMFEFEPCTWYHHIKAGFVRQVISDAFKFVAAYRKLPGFNIKGTIFKQLKKTRQTGLAVPGFFSKDYFFNKKQEPTRTTRLSPRSNYGVLQNQVWSRIFELSHPGFTGKKVKVRQPFFSLDLLLFLRSLPPHLLYQKALLRMAMLPYLPYDVLSRPKTILFGTPHVSNLKTPGVIEKFKDRVLLSQDFLNGKIDVDAIIRKLDNPEHLSPEEYLVITRVNIILAWRNFEK